MRVLHSQRYAEIRKILTVEEIEALTSLVKAADYRSQELDEIGSTYEACSLWRDATILSVIIGYDPVEHVPQSIETKSSNPL